ncbi:unnamed protein product, partial [Mycena citricolor]
EIRNRCIYSGLAVSALGHTTSSAFTKVTFSRPRDIVCFRPKIVWIRRPGGRDWRDRRKPSRGWRIPVTGPRAE